MCPRGYRVLRVSLPAKLRQRFYASLVSVSSDAHAATDTCWAALVNENEERLRDWHLRHKIFKTLP